MRFVSTALLCLAMVAACGSNEDPPPNGAGGAGGGGGGGGTPIENGLGCGDVLSCRFRCDSLICDRRCIASVRESSAETLDAFLTCVESSGCVGLDNEIACLRAACANVILSCEEDRNKPMACLDLTQCMVHCPDSQCESRCVELATDDAADRIDALLSCIETRCAGSDDPDCGKKLCAAERDACFKD